MKSVVSLAKLEGQKFATLKVMVATIYSSSLEFILSIYLCLL